MNDFDIPIFKKSYDLYKTLHEYRKLVPKQDRYTIYERIDTLTLDVIGGIIMASNQQKLAKVPTLELVSTKLNILRVLIRLLKDTNAIDMKKYLSFEASIDEIGRMLGGWIRSARAN